MDFKEHIQNMLNKLSKTIGWVLRKLQKLLQRSSLMTIYKSFIRPYLYYGDICTIKHIKVFFHQKLESIQYKATVAITEGL